MRRLAYTFAALLGLAGPGTVMPAFGHAEAGDREFPATLTIDDPGVENEASVPTVTSGPRGTADGRPTAFGYEIDKVITEQLGVGINDSYTMLNPPGSRHRYGWQDFSTTLKYQAITDAPGEFLTSIGITRDWGGTGAASVGADRNGSTTPTLYFGKGLGDVAIDTLRPLAITGTLGWQLPDVTRGDPQQLAMGLSVQYSLPYLAEVMGVELPGFTSGLTPLVEMSWTTPTMRAGGVTTEGLIAPGLIYANETYQLGIEALIPATRATGRDVGVLAQFHVYFAEFVPELGETLF